MSIFKKYQNFTIFKNGSTARRIILYNTIEDIRMSCPCQKNVIQTLLIIIIDASHEIRLHSSCLVPARSTSNGRT